MMRADHDWMLWRRRHAGPIGFSQCKNGNCGLKSLRRYLQARNRCAPVRQLRPVAGNYFTDFDF